MYIYSHSTHARAYTIQQYSNTAIQPSHMVRSSSSVASSSESERFAFLTSNVSRCASSLSCLLNLDEMNSSDSPRHPCTCCTGDHECAWRRRRRSWSSSCTAPAASCRSCSETIETESQQSPERLGAPLAAGRLRRDPDAVVCDASVWFMPRRELMMCLFVCGGVCLCRCK